MIPHPRQHRVGKACEGCRRRKVRCSGDDICAECQKYGEECVYRKIYRRPKDPKKAGKPKEFAGPLNSIPQSVLLNEGQSKENASVEGLNSTFSIGEIHSLGTDFFKDLTQEKYESNLQYYGPISNFTFVNQLNHYLRYAESRMNKDNESILPKGLSIEEETEGLEMFGMKSTVLSNASYKSAEYLLHLPMYQVSKLLAGFLETWAVPTPLFTAEEVFSLSFETWNNPSASPQNKATLYLILSLGAAASYFDTPPPPDMLATQRGFYELALEAVPNLMSEVSVEAITISFLLCSAACTMGDTALSYIYSGHAMRLCIAIGLDKEVMIDPLPPALYKRHRLWTSIWQFENYWSFCVGRPSSNSRDIPKPTVNKDAFTFAGFGDMSRFRITAEHMRIRIEFGAICSQIYNEIFNTHNTLDNVVATMNNVDRLSHQVDLIYLSTPAQYLIRAEVDPVECAKMNKTEVREWFWIRIYYLYLKLIIFRPFLVFYAYLGLSDTAPKPEMSAKMKEGADTCVRMAIDLLKFVIDLNRAVRMQQSIFFICTYMESSCAVMLFYLVSNFQTLSPELADSIGNALDDTTSFLENCTGPYIGSIKVMTRMGLSILRGGNQRTLSNPEE